MNSMEPADGAGASRHPVSAVVITMNEAANIERCLASVRWCDEIVVVDSGSSDATAALAERHGCRVWVRPFTGYGDQKQFAVTQASHDWILSIDADEVITPPLRDELSALLEQGGGDLAGVEIPRTMVFLGREFRHGAEHASPLLRMFRRSRGGFTSAAVHERVEVKGPVKRCRAEMLHYSYVSIEQYLQKFNAYTSAAARMLHAEGRRRSAAALCLAFPLAFLRQYVINGNFLNGYPGFLWAFLSAVYPVVKYAKLRELSRL
jgi:glycosyltransferase involved in cell wall biosynthesis